MIRSIQLLVILCLGANLGFGQNLREEFVAMNEYLGSLSNYRLGVSYSAGNEEESDEGDVSVVVDNRGLFYHLGTSKLIINKQHTILVDDSDHLLVYSDNQEVKKPNESFSLADQMLRGIDTLVQSADSIYFHTEDGRRIYTVRFTDAYFDLIQLSFEGKILREIEYFYNEAYVDEKGLRAKCNVTLEPNVTIDATLLQTSFYLREQNGEYVPSDNFNNYLIIYNESLESYFD